MAYNIGASVADSGYVAVLSSSAIATGNSQAQFVTGFASAVDGEADGAAVSAGTSGAGDAVGVLALATCSGAGTPYSGKFGPGNFEVKLDAGQTLTIKDHLGNPKVQFTEGSPNLHIPTGGTVIADL